MFFLKSQTKIFLYNVIALGIALVSIGGAYTLHFLETGFTASCSDFNGDQITCQNTVGCSWPYPLGTGSCSDFNNNPLGCAAVPGCSYPGNNGSCSAFNGNQSTCQATSGCTYPGNNGSCSSFNGNQSACQNTTGCVYPGNAGVCSNIADQGTCGSTTGCSVSSGSCSGDFFDESSCNAVFGCNWMGTSCEGTYYAGCTGTYDDGSCTGGYDDGSCTGTYDDGSCSGTYNHLTCAGTYDITAPTVSSITVDGTVLSIVFNEALNESAVPNNDSFTVTVDGASIGSPSHVAISGSTVTVTVANVGVGSEVKVSYSVSVGGNIIEDIAGNDTNAFSNQDATNNTTDLVAPTITSITSDRGDTIYSVGEIIDIDVAFSENVTSTGDVTVTLETGTTDRTCTFSVSNEGSGTCNYEVQAGDTTSDLNVSSVSGTIEDQAGNPMVTFVPASNLADTSNIEIDTTVPTMQSFSPLDNAVDVSTTSNLVITFSEPVFVQFGNLVIKRVADDTTFETINILSDKVTGTGTTVITFNPATDFASGTEYYVELPALVLIDGAGNTYSALSGSTAWNFTTAAAVVSGSSGGGKSDRPTASCAVSNRNPSVGEAVTFTVDVDARGSYSFVWTNELSGEEETLQHVFQTAGTYYPRGQVRSSAGTATVTCGSVGVEQGGTTSNQHTTTSTPENQEAIATFIRQNLTLLRQLLSQGFELPQFVRDIVDQEMQFEVDLEFGMNHPDVRRLQIFLNTEGFPVAVAGPGSSGFETTLFGYATQNALQLFQQARGISPAAGYFGPITRSVINGQ